MEHQHRIPVSGQKTDTRRGGLPATQVPPHLASLAALQRMADNRHAPVQRNALEEEEPLQGAGLEEEEPLQGADLDEEDPLQGAGLEEEEPLQGAGLTPAPSGLAGPLQRKPEADDRDGLPRQLRAGIEALSGVSMDGVHVHRNSSAPAHVSAHAFAQGRDIHLGPGQEKHLPHEAWHVVQQAQGRVKPTMQAKGVAINDDPALEAEADRMGKLAQAQRSNVAPITKTSPSAAALQRHPKPSLGEPKTYGLYEAQKSSKNQEFTGDTKPTFGPRLYTLRLSEFAGAEEKSNSIIANSTTGRRPVTREFVQLDHNPSWDERKNDLLNFAINNPNSKTLESYKEKGLYRQIGKKIVPSVYAARMYYNDYDSLVPASPGMNASAGAKGVDSVGRTGTFEEEAVKEYIMHEVGNLTAALFDGLGIEDVNESDFLTNIKVAIARLNKLHDDIAGRRKNNTNNTSDTSDPMDTT